MKKVLEIKGFTLVETLVAVLLLTLSISGPLWMAQQSFVAARISQSQTVARFLAQEGVELVRGVRDTNILKSEEWLFGLTECRTEFGCEIHHINTGTQVVRVCSEDDGCNPLKFNESEGTYSYLSGSNYTVSSFVREVTITDITPDKDVEVFVKVSWNDRGIIRSVTTQEYLFNWL